MTDQSFSLPDLDRQALPGPHNVLRRELENGIVILVKENPASPSVIISGFHLAGAVHEHPAQAGLAEITAQALTRGTRQRGFQEIYSAVESIGASLAFGAGNHSSSFYAKGLAEDLDLLLDLMGECMLSPSFPKAQVDRLRGERLTGLAIRDQNTRARSSMAFYELAYADHPYAIPTDGTQDSVGGLTRADLVAFHRRLYGPRGMVLAVVGAVACEEAAAAVEARFAAWRNPQQPTDHALPAVRSLEKTIRKTVSLPGKSQSDLVIGRPGPSRYDDDYLAAALGNSILGRFGLMGRIGDALREAEGLAYYAYSDLAGGPGPGPWQVIAGVNPVNIERAIELAIKELDRFVNRKVTSTELMENQANFIGRLPLQLESNEGMASALVRIERYRLGLDYFQRFPDLIAAITREQILAAAQRYLDPQALAIAIAGSGVNGDR